MIVTAERDRKCRGREKEGVRAGRKWPGPESKRGRCGKALALVVWARSSGVPLCTGSLTRFSVVKETQGSWERMCWVLQTKVTLPLLLSEHNWRCW